MLSTAWLLTPHNISIMTVSPLEPNRMLPQCHIGQTGGVQDLGCNLMNRAANFLKSATLTDLPWCEPCSPSRTLKLISRVLGLPEHHGGFWRVVVSRDLEALFGSSVFQASQCFVLGENGANGLRLLLPRLRACGETRHWNSEAARLQNLHEETCRRLRALLGARLLRLLPNYNIQCTEHNCCELMQQHHRRNAEFDSFRSRPRRCSLELAKMYHAAAPRLQVVSPWDADAAAALERVFMARSDVRMSVSVSDLELLRALSDACPHARRADCWSREWLCDLLAHLQRSNGRA
jgi:hypothetical protein